MQTTLLWALVAISCLIGHEAAAETAETATCSVAPPSDITHAGAEVLNMQSNCAKVVKNHVRVELNAAVTYLAMGAHFLKSQNFRPNVAKKFLEHAGEERQHAKMLIDYLLMRGNSISEIDISKLEPQKIKWVSVYDALTEMLEIEIKVRDAFSEIIEKCDDVKHENADYHISDFLTGNFLDEQHKGVHEIASMLSTLRRLRTDNEDGKPSKYTAFAEMEFDLSIA